MNWKIQKKLVRVETKQATSLILKVIKKKDLICSWKNKNF